ncbi:LSM domain protein [Dictyocaulus viviparus]|uniref:LSM domain protein n=1 Tax=Dictyocaulus viviparus TaxID=29172 RepID=A0A0D8YBF1_DICVI|nr:LSM domain protein [Dictyocaulus viviparus]
MEHHRMNLGLHAFANGLSGMKIYAELRQGTFAIGILDDCDEYFNLRIRDALIIRARKEERVDEFFISGRHLRYIHLDNPTEVKDVLRKSCSLSRI